MKRAFMEEQAAALVELLGGVCERIEVAGSLRRRCAEVGDIELVCVPAYGPDPYGADLFGKGGGSGEIDLLVAKLRDLKQRGVLRDRLGSDGKPAWGPKMVRALYGQKPPVAVDVFMVRPPASWGVIEFIRTGDREYVQRAMMRLRERGLRCEDGRILNEQDIALKADDEREVFRLLGWTYMEPHKRTKARAEAELPPQAAKGEGERGKAEAALGSAGLAAAGEQTEAAPVRPGRCPGHSWRGGLVLAADDVLRPTCEHCGAVRPPSGLL
jgi:DNA polymerase/3'-5' exonuclease PolX